MKPPYILLVFCIATLDATPAQHALPAGFVYLADIAPSIVQDIRYYGPHNFIGKPIAGYGAPECILTLQAAKALAVAQQELEQAGMSLRVYDCYRPRRAVDEFLAWSKNPNDRKMKLEFYPRVNKADLFKLGYLSKKSGHSRGSTVDLTIDRFPILPIPPYDPQAPQRSCIAPFSERYHDGSMDMGTTFDCMDVLSQHDEFVGIAGGSHRQILRGAMERAGFEPYDKEWWHYTLKNEPFPRTYFDFPIVAK